MMMSSVNAVVKTAVSGNPPAEFTWTLPSRVGAAITLFLLRQDADEVHPDSRHVRVRHGRGDDRKHVANGEVDLMVERHSRCARVVEDHAADWAAVLKQIVLLITSRGRPVAEF